MNRTFALAQAAAFLVSLLSAPTVAHGKETLDVPVLRRNCAHAGPKDGLKIAAGIVLREMKDPIPSHAHEPLVLVAAKWPDLLQGVETVGAFDDDFVCLLHYDRNQVRKALEAGKQTLSHFRNRKVAVVFQERAELETDRVFKEIEEVLGQLGVRTVVTVTDKPVGSARALAAVGKGAKADVAIGIEISLTTDERKRRFRGTGRVVVVDTDSARVLGEAKGEPDSLGSTKKATIASLWVWKLLEGTFYDALGNIGR